MGRPVAPRPDFAAARAEIAAVIVLVQNGLAVAAHDISDGGLAQALTEMALGLEGQRRLGARVELPAALAQLTLREALFSEQGGFVVEVPAARAAEAAAVLERTGARWWPLGEVTADDTITVSRAGEPADVPAVRVALDCAGCRLARGTDPALGRRDAAGACRCRGR